MASFCPQIKDKNSFIFPNESFICGINFEGLELNTFDIMIGGIGYGAPASQLLAHGMKAIGSSDLVCNLPFSFEGIDYSRFKYEIVNFKGQTESKDDFQSFVKLEIEKGVSHFNLPLDFNGHASLMHGTVAENGTMEIVFFDSLLCAEEANKKRYDAIMGGLKDLFPLGAGHYKVYHLLDQGDESSSGCGYYTLQTAYLFREKTLEQLLQTFEGRGACLYSSEDDMRIRCELAVRAILHDGIESVDLKKFRWTPHVTTIFHRLGAGSMHKVIKFLENQQQP